MPKKSINTQAKGLKFADDDTLAQNRGARLKKPRKRKKRTTVRKQRSKPTMKAA